MGSQIYKDEFKNIMFTGECHADLDGLDGWILTVINPELGFVVNKAGDKGCFGQGSKGMSFLGLLRLSKV